MLEGGRLPYGAKIRRIRGNAGNVDEVARTIMHARRDHDVAVTAPFQHATMS